MRFAVEHVRRMRGGAQSQLMRCDDGEYYVVKFKNNLQHLRVLANDFFASRLVARMGLTVPEVDIIEVGPSLIENTSDLVMQLASGRLPCASGKQFGSKYVGDPRNTTVYDSIPNADTDRVRNISDFLGILVFDKWACQTDARQAIFVRETGSDSTGESMFRAVMIDHGWCFDGGNWNFPDAPLHSLYRSRLVYQSVFGMETFDPWLDCIENKLTIAELYDEAKRIPPEWYEDDVDAINRLIERLYARRKIVRELIWSARNAVRDAFPNWNEIICPMSVTKTFTRANNVA